MDDFVAPELVFAPFILKFSFFFCCCSFSHPQKLRNEMVMIDLDRETSCRNEFKLLNKLDVGKQIRILNTTQNWVFSKAFRSIAHQTWYMETML